MPNKTRISILICTHNRQPILQKCLSRVFDHGARFPGRVQLVVVDNRSTDGTWKYLDECQTQAMKSGIRFEAIRENTPGKAAALKFGLSRSRGDYFLFLDDDNLLPEDWPEMIDRVLRAYPAHLIGSNNDYTGENEPPWWWPKCQFQYACGAQSDRQNAGFARGAVWGAGMIAPGDVVRALFDNGFRFHTTGRNGSKGLLCGTDTELSLALAVLGLKPVCPPEYRLQHAVNPARINGWYLIRLNFSFGLGDAFLDGYDKFFESRGKKPSKSRLPKFLHRLRVALFRLVRAVNFLKSRTERFGALLEAIYLFGWLYAWLKHRKKNIRARQEILSFCSRLAGSAVPDSGKQFS